MSRTTRIRSGGALSRLDGRALVLAAAVLWGTTGTTQALGPDEASSLAVGSIRALVGGAALVAIAHFRGLLRGSGRWPLLPSFLAAAALAGAQLTFFAAVARTGVAVGTIVTIGSAPVAAGLIDVLVMRSALTRRWLLATALAIGGCTLLSLSGSGLTVDALGIALAVSAGTGYAVYTSASKRLLEDHHPVGVIAVAYGIAALMLLPVLAVQDLSWVASPGGVAVAAHLGLITVAVAYTLFATGLVTIQSSTAVTLTLAEPLTAGLLGVLLLGERLTGPALLGIGLIAAGLAVLMSGRKPPAPEELATL